MYQSKEVWEKPQDKGKEAVRSRMESVQVKMRSKLAAVKMAMTTMVARGKAVSISRGRCRSSKVTEAIWWPLGPLGK